MLLTPGSIASGAVLEGDSATATVGTADAATGVELTAQGRTVLSGVGGSTTRINVPSDAMIDLRPGGSGKSFAGAEADGTGPAVGFVLTDNVPTEEDGRYVYTWQLSESFKGVVSNAAFGTFEEPEPGRFRIPAGDYSLYLISDGSPITLTVEFDGLAGATAATATRTVPLDFQVLGNRVTGGNMQYNVYSVGKKASFLERPGFHAITVATKSPGETAAGFSGSCYYLGAVSNEDTAYLPGCPNEITDGADAQSELRDPTNGVLVQAFRGVSSPPGSRAMGYWRVTSKPLEQMAALGYVLPYDPAFAPPAGA